jgi:hypothetical protein
MSPTCNSDAAKQYGLGKRPMPYKTYALIIARFRPGPKHGYFHRTASISSARLTALANDMQVACCSFCLDPSMFLARAFPSVQFAALHVREIHSLNALD